MIWLRCPACRQPRRGGYDTHERARYYNPRVDPRTSFIVERDLRPGFPPMAYRGFCSC